MDAEIEEEIRVAWNKVYMDSYLDSTTDKANALKTELEKNGYTVESVSENGTKITIINYRGKNKIVDISTGRVEDNIDLEQIAVEEWKVNEDGSYSKGSTNGVKVGDQVYYERVLNKEENAVDIEKLSNLKSDLATYSGDNSSSDNASIDRDSLTWIVLDIKNGKIRLISTELTTHKLRLQGADGYNNGVYLLDEACDILYSAKGLGKSQNLKIEDIEDKLSNTGREARDNYVSSLGTKYRETQEYTSNTEYPNIYSSEIGCKGINGISGTDNNNGTLGLSSQTREQLVLGINSNSSRLKVTQTYWSKSISASDFKDLDSNSDSKYFKMFRMSGQPAASYWLSSRFATCIDESTYGPRFGIYEITKKKKSTINTISGCSLFINPTTSSSSSIYFRPVVTLESNVQLSLESTYENKNYWSIN